MLVEGFRLGTATHITWIATHTLLLAGALTGFEGWQQCASKDCVDRGVSISLLDKNKK
jgi:hypothetical protein